MGAHATRRTEATPPPAGWRAWRPAAVAVRPRVLAVAVGAGVLAGAGGVVLTLLLHAVQWLAFGAYEHDFRDPGAHAGPARRVLALLVGGLTVGVAWWAFRRRHPAPQTAERAIAEPEPRLAVLPASLDAAIQIVAVGAGASVGREGAPRQVGAALADWLSRRARLTAEERRLVLAAGAGAGLAAVYNVPVGGFLFALEATLGWRRPAAVLPALLASATATVVAWPVLGRGAVYRLAPTHPSPALLAWAVAVGLVAGMVGVAFRALMAGQRRRAAAGTQLLVAMPLAFLAVGLASVLQPSVLGNGKALGQLALDTPLPLALAVGLLLLKPAATALTLRAGAVGGLLQPSFSTGAVVGSLLALLPWAHDLRPELVLLAAATVLAVAQRMPATGAALALEFCQAPAAMVAPVLVAVAVGWGVHAALSASRRPRPPG